MATPEDYLRRFHAMSVVDARLGINAAFDITRYISGMDSKGELEKNKISGIIAGRYFGSKHFSVSDLIKQSQPFRIKTETRIDANEPWTYGSIQRAFGGRASPGEFADGLRLAVLTGRCKAANAAAYAAEHFGLDCNAFVGNWLGVSPSTSINAYVHGYGSKAPGGASPDVLVTKDIVQLPPIDDPAKIKRGSVLVTYTSEKDGRGMHWRHIALVQSIQHLTKDDYNITLAEWGKEGPFETHMTRNRLVTITDDKQPKGREGKEEPFMVKGRKTLAFHARWGKHHLPALRMFLDSTSLDWCEHRGWEVGGLYGT
jgi:hypothetical protein